MINLFANLLILLLFITSKPFLIAGNNIVGLVRPPVKADPDWHLDLRIHVDGGNRRYLGFVDSRGHFNVSNVQPSSYLVEPIHPLYHFQQARVDISARSGGKLRARRVNAPQPNAVKELPYPLQLDVLGKAVYFKPREQLATLDLLLNANVLYLVVPLLAAMLLARLANTNDPEVRQELAKQQASLFGGLSKLSGGGGSSNDHDRRDGDGSGQDNLPRLPPMSELLASLSGGGGPSGSSRRSGATDSTTRRRSTRHPGDSSSTSTARTSTTGRSKR